MLAGELTPDQGEILVGSTVKLAHFKQTLPKMNENERMIEYIREASNDITDAEGVRYSAAQMLERFYSRCMLTAHQLENYRAVSASVFIYYVY